MRSRPLLTPRPDQRRDGVHAAPGAVPEAAARRRSTSGVTSATGMRGSRRTAWSSRHRGCRTARSGRTRTGRCRSSARTRAWSRPARPGSRSPRSSGPAAPSPGTQAPLRPDPPGLHAELGANPDHRLLQCAVRSRPRPRLAEPTIGYPTSCPGPCQVIFPPRSTSITGAPGRRSAGRAAVRLPAVYTGACSSSRQLSGNPSATPGHARAAAGPTRPRGNPPRRRRTQGRQARSLSPAYARPGGGRAGPARHGSAQRAAGQAHNEEVIDKAELRRMSQPERRELARLLAELDTACRPRSRPIRTGSTRSCAVSGGSPCSSRRPAA